MHPTAPRAPSSPPRWRSFRAHLGRHRGAYALGVGSLVLVNAIDGVAAPWLQGAAFANLERSPDLRVSFAKIAAAFALAAVFQMGLRYAWRHYFIRTADRIGAEVREALFARLQGLPISYYDRARTGDLMSRVTNDINDLRTAAGMGMLLLADSLIYLLLVVPQLVYLSPRLALITFVCLPLVPALVIWGGRVVHARGLRIQELMGDLTARIQESFSGIRVVKAFGQEDHETRRLERLATEYKTGQVRLARFQAGFNPALGLVFDLALLAVVLLGGREVIDGRLTLAEFVVYTRALDKIVWPMMAMGWVTGMLQRGLAAQQRIDAVLAEALDPASAAVGPDLGAGGDAGAAAAAAVPPLRGRVALQGLTFRYPAAPAERPPALSDVTFEAAPGSFVAIVGPVGAGKSTLLSLLLRLYEPPPGTVLLDGRDLLELPPAVLRRDVALVPQETFLFSASIAENVAFGRQGSIPRDAVEEACRVARVDDEVRALPGAYDAQLGERGVNLSGGQRQRLAIARALARAPRVVLLDDALSAVDVETEAGIARAVRDRLGATRIVATHRLSAARDADLIVVLDRGRVVAQGKHPELLASCSLYQRLARQEALTAEVSLG